MNWKNEALKKLDRECTGFTGDRYALAMKEAVADALRDFCQQNEEFAQAVVQGGSFTDCMKAVAKGCGSALSDLEAYRRAAAFYFRDAQVKMELRIQLEPDAEEDGKLICLDFADFFS